MNIVILFTAATATYVVLNTLRSLMTIKGGKWLAAIANAITYGFYPAIIILTTADLPLWEVMAITAACNFVGVFIVKFIEQKTRKDKLWKVEMALPDIGTRCTMDVYVQWLEKQGIPCNYQKSGHWWIFNCYCETSAQTQYVTDLCKAEGGKISAYESQTLAL